jgi:ABC-type transporter MlaC component
MSNLSEVSFAVMLPQIADEMAEHVYEKMDKRAMSTFSYIQMTRCVNNTIKKEYQTFFDILDIDTNTDIKSAVSLIVKKVLSTADPEQVKEYILENMRIGYRSVDKDKIKADMKIFAPHLLTKYADYLE